MNNNERLGQLRKRARELGYDLAWACANQAWAIFDYRPYAPKTAKLHGVRNNLDEVEAFLEEIGNEQCEEMKCWASSRESSPAQ